LGLSIRGAHSNDAEQKTVTPSLAKECAVPLAAAADGLASWSMAKVRPPHGLMQLHKFLNDFVELALGYFFQYNALRIPSKD